MFKAKMTVFLYVYSNYNSFCIFTKKAVFLYVY